MADNTDTDGITDGKGLGLMKIRPPEPEIQSTHTFCADVFAQYRGRTLLHQACVHLSPSSQQCKGEAVSPSLDVRPIRLTGGTQLAAAASPLRQPHRNVPYSLLLLLHHAPMHLAHARCGFSMPLRYR